MIPRPRSAIKCADCSSQRGREGSAYGNSILTQKPRVVGSYRAVMVTDLVMGKFLDTEKKAPSPI